MLHEPYYLCVCVELPTTKAIITHHLPIVPFNKCCTFLVLPIQLVQNKNRKIRLNFDQMYEKHNNNNNNMNAFMCAMCTCTHTQTPTIDSKIKIKIKKSIRFKDALTMWCARDHSYCTQRICKKEKQQQQQRQQRQKKKMRKILFLFYFNCRWNKRMFSMWLSAYKLPFLMNVNNVVYCGTLFVSLLFALSHSNWNGM